MKHCIAVLALVGSLCAPGLPAWDWPLAQPYIQKDFAGELAGSFYPGLLLGSLDPEALDVKVMDPGELIFERRAGDRKARIPWGPGVVKVVDHPGGMRVLYGGLASTETRSAAKGSLVRGEVIGSMGSTPFSDEPGMWVMVLDPKRSSVVNPMVLLPSLDDQRRPIIHEVGLLWPESETPEPLARRTEARGQSPRLYGYFRDYHLAPQGASSAAGLPYIISVVLNGEQIWRMEKQALVTATGGFALVKGPGAFLQHSAVYQAGGAMDLGLLPLKAGTNRVDIVVVDYAGNRSGTQYFITWKPPQN